MDENKKQIISEQIKKINEVMGTLRENFDIERKVINEYSYLMLVKDNFEYMVDHD